MFRRKVESRPSNPLMVDVFLDCWTAEKFKHYSAARNIDESHALAEILERGIANYWLLEFKGLKENYQHIVPIHNEYKKDNETLNSLEEENEKLKKILKNSLSTKEKTSPKSEEANA